MSLIREALVRGVRVYTYTPRVQKPSSAQLPVCAQNHRKLSSWVRTGFGPGVYMYTRTPLAVMVALAGAVLATSPKAAKRPPAWLKLPPTHTVKIGDCVKCGRTVLTGYDDSPVAAIPVALDLVSITGPLMELGYLLRGLPAFEIRRDRARGRLVATYRDASRITRQSRIISGPLCILPWHDCPAGGWRWSA